MFDELKLVQIIIEKRERFQGKGVEWNVDLGLRLRLVLCTKARSAEATVMSHCFDSCKKMQR